MSSHWKALIAVNSETDYRQLQAVFDAEGWQVLRADNGKQLLDISAQSRPHVIVSSSRLNYVSLPDIIQSVKHQGDFQPLIWVACDGYQDCQREALLCGADDILTRPFDPLWLRRKIKALQHFSGQNEPAEKADEDVEKKYRRMQYEFDMVELVYKHATEYRNDSFPGLRYHTSPKAFSNGDIFLIKQSPQGRWKFLLGDFSGHGLYAAMNAWPVGETFHAMTAKDCSIELIAAEINNKLLRLLPPQLFLAACVGEFDPEISRLSIINAGMPDAVLYNARNDYVEYICSSSQPFGVQQHADYSHSRRRFEIRRDDYLYICSDGVIEARCWDDSQFGETRYQDLFTDTEADDWSDSQFDSIQESLMAFREGHPQDDDLSLLELKLG